jgi:hypothetical protein
MIKMTKYEAIGHLISGRLEKLDFLPQIQNLYARFNAEKEGLSRGYLHKLKYSYQELLGVMLLDAGSLKPTNKKDAMSKEQRGAFKDFMQGNLSQLEFIPNVHELRDNFMKALEGTCCKSRSQAVTTHRELFLKAFEANQ